MPKTKQITKGEIAVLGGGCFWCLEAAFSKLKGVKEVISGYAGGTDENPTYESVSSGQTGHAEVVKVIFDSESISYGDLLGIFFSLHDFTMLNRQGNDIGTQYRSIILYVDEKQREEAKKILTEISSQKIYKDEPVTELKVFEQFYPAEEYHQKYFEKNPQAAYCQIVIEPKLAKFRKKYGSLYA